MKFKEELPVWKNEGIKPTETKINEGWNVGDKPPADWFNWFQNRTWKNIEELRSALNDVDGKIGDLNVTELKTSVDDLQRRFNKNKPIDLREDNDLDEVFDVGFYSGWKTQNAPCNYFYMIVLQYSNKSDILQVVINWQSSNEIYIRNQKTLANGDSYFTDWVRVDGTGKAEKSYVDNQLSKKVDKITGKGLSTNDYTDMDKQKIYTNEDRIDSLNNQFKTHKSDYNKFKEDVKNSIIIKRNVIIPSGKNGEWKVDKQGRYWIYIYDDDITPNTIVDVNIDIDSVEDALVLMQSTLSLTSKVVIYAYEKPENDIKCDFKLIREVL